MRFELVAVTGLLVSACWAQAFEEKFTSIDVGSDVYSNVTVTSVTTTHIYFTHARGLGSARIADLNPALQQHFRFDAAAAEARLAQQARENGLYGEQARQAAAARKREQENAATNLPPESALLAKSFLNRPAPPLMFEKWLSAPPDMKGKFVLVDIWATWCPPCRKSIPHLNELQAKFSDRLVVVGISSETEDVIRKMTDPKIEYAVASDPQGRTSKELEVKAIPHAMLVDPKGIVRYQGLPQYLSEAQLEKLLTDDSTDKPTQEVSSLAAHPTRSK
jgi:cytochrome c biogenesis protein CcmG, thiol:disulfide interchange protein DsbE